MKIPNYVLCSHYPIEHSVSPCASIYQLFIGNNRIADLYDYIYVVEDKNYLYEKLNNLKGNFVFLFNGYASLLNENSLTILRYAFMNNISVTVYWHETAWNLRDLSRKSKIDVYELQSILLSLNLTNFVPTSQCMHAVCTAFGFPFESFKIVFEVYDSNKFISKPNDYNYKNKSILFGGAGLPNYRKGVDIYSYIAHNIKKIYDSEFIWFASTPGILESKRVPFYEDIEFVGHYKNFYEQLKQIDIFLLTSRDDPSPLVALEALALNKPTFAYASSGYIEVLPSEFIAYSHDDMINKIRYFIENGKYHDQYFSDIAKRFSTKNFIYRAYTNNNFDLNIPESGINFLPNNKDDELYLQKINKLINKEIILKRKELALAATKEESYNVTKLEEYKKYIKNSRIKIRKLLYGNVNKTKNVCVIGNGPSVTDKKMGKIIDNFDVVIRINNFTTKNYEEYTGSKTTYAVISPACQFSSELNNLSKNNIYVFGAQYTHTDDIISRIMRNDGCKINIKKENILCHELYFDGLNVMLNLLKNQWASTGMVAIQWAVDLFKKPIYIYGFDFTINNNGIIEHYFHHETKEDKHHNFYAEKKRIEFMIKNNEIIKL